MIVYDDGSGGLITITETTDFRQSTIVNGEMLAAKESVKESDNRGLLIVAGLVVLAVALDRRWR